MLEQKYTNLPIAKIATSVNAALNEGSHRVVVTAPPGAGKSTLLPLTILESLGEKGKVVLMEPRRIAARQIAERMAAMLGEDVGKTIGYRVRFENKISLSTRIEVVTEGILTRMMVDNPTLEGIDAVIFDEFHERSISSDVSLALVAETQSIIRPDLKLLIMSATIDATSICEKYNAIHIESGGSMFPVHIFYSEKDLAADEVATEVARTIISAHHRHDGGILAFLPGEADIRRCERMLIDNIDDSQTDIFPLYGMLPFDEQRRAIAPSPHGRNKIVLATSIAETSLTIEDCRIVVDSGLCKKVIYNASRGLNHMKTIRISMDMATQRSGRAGRTSEGICYRLWTRATERRMALQRTPEILEADLCPMILNIAAWGERDVRRLMWLSPPPEFGIRQAAELLNLLRATKDDGSITMRGRSLAALPSHPRISSMLLGAATQEKKSIATDIAAILEEKDPMSMNVNNSDLSIRVSELRRMRAAGKATSKQWNRIMQVAHQYRQMIGTREDNSPVDSFSIGALLAEAYPERIAHSHKNRCGCFQLACGGFVEAGKNDAITAYEWLVVASLNDVPESPGRIFLAAPLHPDDITHMVRERDISIWDSREGAVISRHERNIGGLLVESKPLHGISRETNDKILCEAAKKYGRSMFNFGDEDIHNLQKRVATAASWHPELNLPDLSTDVVLERAEDWLPLYSGGANTTTALKKINLRDALWSLLDYEQQAAVDRITPTTLTVPTGSKIKLEYRQGADVPVLRVRLQECFGLIDTPRIDDGRKTILMELLSPGYKSVQLTQDLRSFWTEAYFEVRKDLRRRYPKHSWPDNPFEAKAVNGVTKKGKNY